MHDAITASDASFAMSGVLLQVGAALGCVVGCTSMRAAAIGGRTVLRRPASTCVSPLRRADVLSTTLNEHKVGWIFVTTRSNAFRCALMHLARCGPECVRLVPCVCVGVYVRARFAGF